MGVVVVWWVLMVNMLSIIRFMFRVLLVLKVLLNVGRFVVSR